MVISRLITALELLQGVCNHLEKGGKYYVWKTTNCDELKGWQIFNAEGQMIVPAE